MKWGKNIIEWHNWFAWYPVEIRYGQWVWLETISRRYKGFMFCWDYKYKLESQ